MQHPKPAEQIPLFTASPDHRQFRSTHLLLRTAEQQLAALIAKSYPEENWTAELTRARGLILQASDAMIAAAVAHRIENAD